MAFTVQDNTPSAGYIAWSGVHIVYKGVDYTITNGNSNKRFIWWDMTYPTVLQASDTFPNMTDDDVLVFLNKNGIHVTVPTATTIDGSLIVPESILANAIAANQITSEHIVAGAIEATHIAAGAIGAEAIAAGAILADAIAAGAISSDHISTDGIIANKIIGGQLLAYLLEIVGRGGGFRVTGEGFSAYDESGVELGTFGRYLEQGDQLVTFARDSSAYDKAGNLLDANMPRFEAGAVPSSIVPMTDIAASRGFEGCAGIHIGVASNPNSISTPFGGNWVASTHYADTLIGMADGGINGGKMVIFEHKATPAWAALRTSPSFTLKPGKAYFFEVYVLANQQSAATFSTCHAFYIDANNKVSFVFEKNPLQNPGEWIKGTATVVVNSEKSGSTYLYGSNNGDNGLQICYSGWQVREGRGLMIEEGTTNIVPVEKQKFEDWSAYQGAVVTITQGQSVPEWGTNEATRVQTTGGTHTTKYYISLVAPSIDGQPYSLRLKIKNIGVATIRISMNLPNGSQNVAPGETVDLESHAVGNGSSHLQMVFATNNASDNIDCIVYQPQVETKQFCTSFYPSTRAAEALVLNPNGIFNKGNWTIDLYFIPNIVQTVTQQFLWRLYIDTNNWYGIWIEANKRLRGSVVSGGTTYTIEDTVDITPGAPYFISFAGDGTTLSLCKNGVLVGSRSYLEPVGTLPLSMNIGSDQTSARQANGIFDDFRISNRARTLLEHQEANANGALEVDGWTTHHLSFEGVLTPSVRQFGLHIRKGKIEAETIVATKTMGGIVDAVDGFGDGHDGHFNSAGDVTIPVDNEDLSTIVKQYESFVLNAGHTLTVDKRCRGLFFFCRGDVTINGTIDINGRGAFVDKTISPQHALQIPLGVITLVIPAGGSGGVGGNGGKGGTGYSPSNNGGAGGSGAQGSGGTWFGGGFGGPGGGGGGGGGRDYDSDDTGRGGAGGQGGIIDLKLPMGNGGSGGGGGAGGNRDGGPGNVGGNYGGGGGGGGAQYPGSYWSYDGGNGGNRGGGGGGGAGGPGSGTTSGVGSPGGSDGGRGGGLLVIIAKGKVTIGSSGVISANGTPGATGGKGGGGYSALTPDSGEGGGGGGQGGGGGGVVVIAHRGDFVNSGTITVNGGLGGTGGSKGDDITGNSYHDAANGSNGNAGAVGTILVQQV